MGLAPGLVAAHPFVAGAQDPMPDLLYLKTLQPYQMAVPSPIPRVVVTTITKLKY